MIELHDSFVLDDVRKTADGYVTAFARVARTGIQTYKGYELGRPDLETVRVYRPPSEVFAPDAMRSFAHRPVTLKHPPKPVNAKNWRQYAGGQTGEDVVRDGEYIRVPLVMMDANLISAYEEKGMDQLSMGYSTDIQWTQGVTDSGEAYDAVQTAIRANHLALVPVARGGDRLRVGDAKKRGQVDPEQDDDEDDDVNTYDRDFSTEQRKEAAKTGAAMPDGSYPIKNRGDLENAIRAIGRAKDPSATKAHIKSRAKALGAEDLIPSNWTADAANNSGEQVMKLVIDGLNVSVADEQSAAIIQRHLDGLAKRLTDADAAMAEQKKKQADVEKECTDAKAAVSAKDGEIAVLKQKITDAEVTPAKLDVMVKDRLAVIDAAAKLLSKEFSYDGKTIAEIRKAAVEVKLGDAAKNMDDAAIGGAFAALSADAAVKNVQPIVDAFAARRPNGGTANAVSDAAYNDYVKSIGDAWKAKA